jgi:hypothetical protein
MLGTKPHGLISKNTAKPAAAGEFRTRPPSLTPSSRSARFHRQRLSANLLPELLVVPRGFGTCPAQARGAVKVQLRPIKQTHEIK